MPDSNEEYFRRYLNDTTTIPVSGQAIIVPISTETADTSYFRRYLNDPAD